MIKMQKCHIVSHWPSLTCVTKCQTRANRRGALTSEVSWDPMAAVGRPGSCGKTWKNRNTPKPGHGSSWPWPWHHGTMARPKLVGSVTVSWYQLCHEMNNMNIYEHASPAMSCCHEAFMKPSCILCDFLIFFSYFLHFHRLYRYPSK